MDRLGELTDYYELLLEAELDGEMDDLLRQHQVDPFLLSQGGVDFSAEYLYLSPEQWSGLQDLSDKLNQLGIEGKDTEVPLYFALLPEANNKGYRTHFMFLPDEEQLSRGNPVSINILRHENNADFMSIYDLFKEDMDQLAIAYGHTHPAPYGSCPSGALPGQDCSQWGGDIAFVRRFLGMEHGAEAKYAPIHIIMAPWLNTIGAFRFNPEKKSISYFNIIEKIEFEQQELQN